MAARLLATTVLFVPLMPSARAAALRAAEQDTVNFAFATQLGSGVYDVSGRDIQIYRLPFEWTLSEGSPGYRLLLPVAFGFYDFEATDLLDEGLPSGFDTLSFTPGLELDFPLPRDWIFSPSAMLGRAWEESGAGNAVIGTVRVRALQEIEQVRGRRRLHATLGYTLIDFDELTDSGDVLYLELDGEVRREFGWRLGTLDLDAGAYAVLQWFVDRPDTPVARTTEEHGFAAVQLELGLTVGATGDRRIWGMPWPRLGVGYRMGDGLSVWRFVVGGAF